MALLCPKCKKPGIQYMIGGITGQYQCKCGYAGTLVLEEFEDEDK